MRQILQQEVVPTLRELGFRGTMPHFHRRRHDRLDLLNVKFSQNGQYFFINLGRIQLPHDRTGSIEKPTRKHLSLANCPIGQRTRLAIGALPKRLGGGRRPGFDMWDFFSETDTGSDELMHKLARQLREWLSPYADPWWRDETLKGDRWKIDPGLAS
jgi:Domain of unknown function (DUF4304)